MDFDILGPLDVLYEGVTALTDTPGPLAGDRPAA
jgi:hypothetical protein